MGKPRKTINFGAPSQRKVNTRSASQRKVSVDDSAESHLKPFFQENNYPPPEYFIPQPKPKFFPNHEDIDIYFAPCFNLTEKIKEQVPQNTEMETNCFKETKKGILVLSKQEMLDEALESQVKSDVESIEDNMAKDENFEPEIQQESPESPIYGRKLRSNLRTPRSKLADFKDFEHSEEIARKTFIYQLEDVSKEDYVPKYEDALKDVEEPLENPPSSQNQQNQISPIIPTSPNISISPISPILPIISRVKYQSPNVKTEKRISKRKKAAQNKKVKKIEERIQKTENVEFSFKRQAKIEDERQRAQNLRLPTIRYSWEKYEQCERALKSFENGLITLMNYYRIKETNSKILTFRINVHKLIKEESEKMMTLVTEKKSICQELIMEKQKNPCHDGHYYERMDFPDL